MKMSEHKMLTFSIKKEIIGNNNSLVVISLFKVGVNEFLPNYNSGGNSQRLGYGMCHFLRVLFLLENKFLGLFYGL